MLLLHFRRYPLRMKIKHRVINLWKMLKHKPVVHWSLSTILKNTKYCILNHWIKHNGFHIDKILMHFLYHNKSVHQCKENCNWVNECSLTPTQQFVSYVMARTMRWWWCFLCSRLTLLVSFFIELTHWNNS